MNFSLRRRESRVAEISVVPLIDLFLNILVFFLVTTTFGSDSVFFVDLPEAHSGDREVSGAKQVLIAISSSGELALNQRSIEKAKLYGELSYVPRTERKALPVLIRADKSTLHGVVVSVLDTVRQLGFENVGMATKLEGSALSVPSH